MATQYWKPFKVYKVKITLDDPDSNNLQLQSFQFNLELRDICSNNSITKNADLSASTTYIISAADTTLTPSFTVVSSTDGCQQTATL